MTDDLKTRSRPLFRGVTKHWPRVAAVLVLLVGVTEWVVGGLTADSSLEFYLLAWAGLTGGIWFLFEKAETALSPEGRARVVQWVDGVDMGHATLPTQFAFLFDRIFGERHLSRLCLNRSCMASLIVFAAIWLAKLLAGIDVGVDDIAATTGIRAIIPMAIVVVFGSALLNFLPDYISLLESRWMMGLARGGKAPTPVLLGVDLVLTTAIAAGSLWLVNRLIGFAPPVPAEIGGMMTPSGWDAIPGIAGMAFRPGDHWGSHLLQISFISAFVTSLWFWVYLLAAPLSRYLAKLNSGVGFLLTFADIEAQPLRSIGFVSVVGLSLLFLLGLPFVIAF